MTNHLHTNPGGQFEPRVQLKARDAVLELLSRQSATWEHIKAELGEGISDTVRTLAFEEKVIGYSKRHGYAGGYYFATGATSFGGYYFLL